jgi:centromere/kinetochore protein ZW10
MAADSLTSAVLQYVDHGSFPQDEHVASATLASDTLQVLSKALKEEQEAAREDIRSLSKSAAADVDTWIARAKELQADIERSKVTARQIVAEHEAGRNLHAKVNDQAQKVLLLESEIGFNEDVVIKLEQIKHANGILEGVRDALVRGEVDEPLKQLHEAAESVDGLRESGVGAASILQKKLDKLQETLKDTVQDKWSTGAATSAEGKWLRIQGGLGPVVDAAKGLGLFDGLVLKLSKDIEKAIIRPRMSISRDGKVPEVVLQSDTISCGELSDDTSTSALLRDLRVAIEFLAEKLPTEVSVSLSAHLVSALTTRLEEHWLRAAVPLELEEIPSFQILLDEVMEFADRIDALGWRGSKPLRDWTQSAPRTWLTKRREAVLGDVRSLVFAGLRERQVVERVETQMVSKDDALVAQAGDDEWDTAWDEDAAPPPPGATSNANTPTQEAEDEDMSAWEDEQAPSAATEDEDVSAWDDPEAVPVPQTTSSQPPAQQDVDQEGDAWGWGDGDEPQTPSTPQLENKKDANETEAPDTSAPREMTLRETFTVTAIPDGILELIQQVIRDAQTLAGPEYSSSPIAPASTALYTLPTLGLAIYRAAAPTAYAKIDTGNMLIYNDASRLADRLRAWQAEQSPSSRLRLENDVKALEQFARRAYGSEMESQRTILCDLLDGAQGFSTCAEQPFKMECESAVEQTILRLRDVHRLWDPVLSNSALLQSIGSLLATVLQKMMREIEDLPDISEADSKQLKALCEQASQAKDLFVQPAPDGAQRDMTFVYCPNWLKFQYLAEILDSSLADIRYLWKEGELSLEFDADEVVGLIEALFAESIHRRTAVQEIKRSGGRA